MYPPVNSGYNDVNSLFNYAFATSGQTPYMVNGNQNMTVVTSGNTGPISMNSYNGVNGASYSSFYAPNWGMSAPMYAAGSGYYNFAPTYAPDPTQLAALSTTNDLYNNIMSLDFGAPNFAQAPASGDAQGMAFMSQMFEEMSSALTTALVGDTQDAATTKTVAASSSEEEALANVVQLLNGELEPESPKAVEAMGLLAAVADDPNAFGALADVIAPAETTKVAAKAEDEALISVLTELQGAVETLEAGAATDAAAATATATATDTAAAATTAPDQITAADQTTATQQANRTAATTQAEATTQTQAANAGAAAAQTTAAQQTVSNNPLDTLRSLLANLADPAKGAKIEDKQTLNGVNVTGIAGALLDLIKGNVKNGNQVVGFNANGRLALPDGQETFFDKVEDTSKNTNIVFKANTTNGQVNGDVTLDGKTGRTVLEAVHSLNQVDTPFMIDYMDFLSDNALFSQDKIFGTLPDGRTFTRRSNADGTLTFTIEDASNVKQFVTYNPNTHDIVESLFRYVGEKDQTEVLKTKDGYKVTIKQDGQADISFFVPNPSNTVSATAPAALSQQPTYAPASNRVEINNIRANMAAANNGANNAGANAAANNGANNAGTTAAATNGTNNGNVTLLDRNGTATNTQAHTTAAMTNTNTNTTTNTTAAAITRPTNTTTTNTGLVTTAAAVRPGTTTVQITSPTTNQTTLRVATVAPTVTTAATTTPTVTAAAYRPATTGSVTLTKATATITPTGRNATSVATVSKLPTATASTARLDRYAG